MRKTFYPGLALDSCIKNGKFYFPYLLTVVCAAAFFYICIALSYTPLETDMIRYAYLSEYMTIGSFILGIFILIFLIYTNSFLMKRRARELGLYNVLGMGKRHIALVLSYESLYTWIVGVSGGILLGMLLEKLVIMLAEKLMRIGSVYFFYISPKAILITAAFFGFCILLTLLGNLRRVGRQNAVELLRSGQMGERQPKTRFLIAVLGVVSLGCGYGMAVRTNNSVDALMVYFQAVGLVIIGTYCLFSAVSILVLKLLRGNRRFFYKTKNFIGVSGMLHRMNRNAVGLATICIISTMVMVMISGTLSLYVGTENAIEERYPAQISVEAGYYQGGGFDAEKAAAAVKTVAEEQGAGITRSVCYETTALPMLENGNTLTAVPAGGADQTAFVGNRISAALFTQQGYEALTGEKLGLKKGEMASTMAFGSGSVEFRAYDGGSAMSLTPVKTLKNFYTRTYGTEAMNSYYFILPDMETVLQLGDALGKKLDFTWNMNFDIDLDEEGQIAVTSALREAEERGLGPGTEYQTWRASCRVWADTDAEYALNGGFFFLGIFLGFIFIVAMALIMYYKQISEGYEDRERFRIMRQVGLSKREIKSSINAQVLVVFFAPLIVAGIHLAFNYNLVRLLLAMFAIFRSDTTVWCNLITFGVFAVIYAVMYIATSRTYYDIVSE